MDTFLEKIVAKKKESSDMMFTAGIILAAIVVILVVPAIPVIRSLWTFVFLGVVYGAYLLIKSRNIEYEYIVTNGDLDIDKIVARGRRKRIFSASCKDFDIVAKVKSSEYNHNVQSITSKITAVSSMQSEDAYFIVLNYKGTKTAVFFEPDARMLNNFKTFIPRKVMM